MGRHIPEIIEDDFKPGTHCQFCPVLIDCPKMQQAFQEYAEADEEFVAMLSDADLDRFYSMREQARRFMTVLETTVHHRLVTGGKIPNAKLVEKKVARVWKPGAAAALQAAFGDKAFTSPKSRARRKSRSCRAAARHWRWNMGTSPNRLAYPWRRFPIPGPRRNPSRMHRSSKAMRNRSKRRVSSFRIGFSAPDRVSRELPHLTKFSIRMDQ
jgi:hypothetical protein